MVAHFFKTVLPALKFVLIFRFINENYQLLLNFDCALNAPVLMMDLTRKLTTELSTGSFGFELPGFHAWQIF